MTTDYFEDDNIFQDDDPDVWNEIDDSLNLGPGVISLSPSTPTLTNQVQALETLARRCHQPVVLRNTDPSSGNSELVLACRTRRADKCPPCAEAYEKVLWRSTMEGLPDPAAGDTGLVVLLTTTQPSFGAVHRYAWTHADSHAVKVQYNLPFVSEAEMEDNHPGDYEKLCNARNAVLNNLPQSERLYEGDPYSDSLVGSPLNPATYDYAGQVLYNRMASTMMDRTKKHLLRQMKPYRDLGHDVSIRAFAEYQRRGALHFHFLIVVRRPEDWEHGKNFFPNLSPRLRRRASFSELPQPQPAQVQEVYTSDSYYRVDKSGRLWAHPYLDPAAVNYSNKGLETQLRATWNGGPKTSVPEETRLSLNEWSDPVRSNLLKKWKYPHPMNYTSNYSVPSTVVWGQQFDVRGLATHSDVPSTTKTAAKTAGYVAKYVTKAAGSSFGSLNQLPKGAFRQHMYNIRAETLCQTFTLNFKRNTEGEIRKLKSEVRDLELMVSEYEVLEEVYDTDHSRRTLQISDLGNRLHVELQSLGYGDFEVDELLEDLHNFCEVSDLDIYDDLCKLSVRSKPRYSGLLPFAQRKPARSILELIGEYAELVIADYMLNERHWALTSLIPQKQSQLVKSIADVEDYYPNGATRTLSLLSEHDEVLVNLGGISFTNEDRESNVERRVRNRKYALLRRWADFAGHNGAVVYSHRWRSSISKVRAAQREWYLSQNPHLRLVIPENWEYDAKRSYEMRKTLPTRA